MAPDSSSERASPAVGSFVRAAPSELQDVVCTQIHTGIAPITRYRVVSRILDTVRKRHLQSCCCTWRGLTPREPVRPRRLFAAYRPGKQT